MTKKADPTVHSAENIYMNRIEAKQTNPTKSKKKLLDLCFFKMHFMNSSNTI